MIKRILLMAPVAISTLLLGAHFFRSRMIFFLILCGIMLFVLFLKRVWVPKLVQIFLIVGTYEWIRTLLELVAFRKATGEPWLRLGVILSSVALFTFCSILAFHSTALKQRYRNT